MRKSISLAVLAVLVMAAVVYVGAAVRSHEAASAAVPTLTAGDSSSAAPAGLQAKGRYKKDGNRCYWDPNDNGPNQCTPQVTGRFKKDGNRCYWDANDLGPDQCTPTKGRWKKDGSRCYWDANDSGPNQCDPKETR
jgi:hypothetical protein